MLNMWTRRRSAKVCNFFVDILHGLPLKSQYNSSIAQKPEHKAIETRNARMVQGCQATVQSNASLSSDNRNETKHKALFPKRTQSVTIRQRERSQSVFAGDTSVIVVPLSQNFYRLCVISFPIALQIKFSQNLGYL